MLQKTLLRWQIRRTSAACAMRLRRSAASACPLGERAFAQVRRLIFRRAALSARLAFLEHGIAAPETVLRDPRPAANAASLLPDV